MALVSVLGVPHDPTLPGAIARGGQEPTPRAAELIERQTYLGRQRNPCVDEPLTDEQCANAERIFLRIWDNMPSKPPV